MSVARSTRLTALAVLLFCALPQALRADGLPDLGESAQTDLSPAMEKRLGESAMRDIRWHDPAYLDDPEVTAYMNRLGSRLAGALGNQYQAFHFFVLREPSLNAFAMPGGYIGMHSATILASRSESELAGVVAHEISHVTQHHIARMVGKQKETSLLSLAGMLIAVLASRSNSQVSQAALASGMAAGMQTQLSYSRDFEREADRLGLTLLDTAGFDIRGMSGFFERLQREARLYQNNAPSYLQSHPLTTERIADMSNRISQMHRREVADSFEYQLIQAKLTVIEGVPSETVPLFKNRLKEEKPGSTAEVVARYGLCRALLTAHRMAEANAELFHLRKTKLQSPLFETLAAEIKLEENDRAGAITLYRSALTRYPREKSLIVGLADTLLKHNDPGGAVKLVEGALPDNPQDADLYALQARGYGAMGKRSAQHRAQAELYYLQGRTKDAIEQLQLAQLAGDGSFYELSSVDARLRELQRKEREENKRRQ